jgi:hypothetical protein
MSVFGRTTAAFAVPVVSVADADGPVSAAAVAAARHKAIGRKLVP